MKKSKQILTALRLVETRFGESFTWLNITRLMVISIALLVGAAAVAKETKSPSGTVEINETQFALILGGSIGGGILHFRGKDYPFKTSGLKVGGIGVAKVAAVGEVYDLYDVSQFPGTYVKGSIGFALGGGVGGLILKNENGVVMRLHSTLKGVALTLGVEGMTIKMEGKVEEAEKEGVTSYTVAKGDSLYSIAKRFGVTVDEVKRKNDLKSDTIHPGETLYIPSR